MVCRSERGPPDDLVTRLRDRIVQTDQHTLGGIRWRPGGWEAAVSADELGASASRCSPSPDRSAGGLPGIKRKAPDQWTRG
jgi:hypothetical protein